MTAARAVFVCDGARTPFARFRGGLAAVRADDLAALPLRHLLARHAQLDPAAIDEVILGCANQAGEDNRNVARMALLLAGLPVTVPGVTVNRLCASGLEAVGQGARAIALGEADLVLAGGVESMTRAPYVLGKAEAPFDRVQQLQDTTLGWRFPNPALAQAPSLMPDALPAVMLVPGPRIGTSAASFSADVSGRGCSSAAKVPTANSSAAKIPAAAARAARCCERRAKASWSARPMPCSRARFSAVCAIESTPCACASAGLGKRQPRVVSCSCCTRSKGASALPSTYGARVMLSTPPASTRSASPSAIARAAAAGIFAAELFAIGTFAADEQPRPDTSAEKLAALVPILGPGTSITAGNASGINDGACALLLASEAAAARWGLVPRARVLGLASAGVPPRTMGIGPVPAIGKLLARLGLGLGDFAVVEINEAFAAQVLAVTRALGLADDAAHVNANGGAIALGHPLGASGARLALTALRTLERTGADRALVALCVGVGQGVALALERVR